MQTIEFMRSKNNALVVSRLYFILSILQGITALVLMLKTPSEEHAHLLFGLSSTRLIMASIILIVSLISTALLVETWINPDRFHKRMEQLIRLLSKPRTWGLALLLLGVVFLLGSYFITLIPDISEPFTQGVFNRLLPVAVWITGLSAQTLIALLVLCYGTDLLKLRPRNTAFYLAVLTLIGIFLTWSLVMQEILATESQITGWNNMGVPIIETQLFIAWGAGMVMLIVIALVNNHRELSSRLRKFIPQKIDFLIAFLLWLFSVILWQSVPITPSWFLAEPTYPNFEYYPTSDARSYDVVTQTALIGEGYLFNAAPVVKRPLHTLFITILRLLGDQNYNTVVFLQILVLALFPALIYLLAKSLHNQVSGVIAAVIVILREANSIAIAGAITASHTKLIMADFPAAFTNAIFILLTIQILKNIEERRLLALVSGAALGFSMLIRLESFVFLFPLLVIMALSLFPQKQYSLWIKSTLLFLLGITLVITPWIWRNWKVTGIVYIDSPYFRYNLIAQRFRPVATKIPEPTVEIIKSPQPTNTPTSYPTEIPLSTTPTSHPTEIPLSTTTTSYPTEIPLSTTTTNYPTEIPLPTTTASHPTEIPLSTTTASHPTEIPLSTTTEPTIEATKSLEPTETPVNYTREAPPSATPLVASPVITVTPSKPSPPIEEQVRITMEEAISFVKENPHQLVSFSLAHYLNSQLQTILIIPSSFRAMESITGFIGHRSFDKLWEECCSLSSYVRRMPYWHKWDCKFPSRTFIPLAINSIILATGIYVSWKRHKYTGIAPLLFGATYLVFNAIFRNSGGRYVLPVDWTVVVYFSIGLAHLSVYIICYITKADIADSFIIPQGPPSFSPKTDNLLRTPKFYAVIIGILLLTWMIPVVEMSFPRIYTKSRQQEMVNSLFQGELLSETQRQDLQTFLTQGGLVYAGRALYPQYYRANAGGIGDRSSFQSPKPYARLIFYLVGQYNSNLVMPMRDKPSYFPNASDVLVFMCPQEDVLAVTVYDRSGSPKAIWMNSSYPTDILCPIPLPKRND